ncbi:MAG: DUF4923 family protein [Muribaculaceae bacterium]|nr:DUF4923 family protein [Muribaculaceae bacterium]
MKKIAKSIIVLLMAVATATPSAIADDNNSNSSSALKSLFQKLGSNSNNNSSNTTTTTSEQNQSSSSSSGLSSILGSLGSIGDVIQNVISTDNIDVTDLVGTWTYSAPAVAFKSDNLLQKAGGAAAASTIEKKLANYYRYARIQSMTLTVKEDSTFTMSFNKLKLSGDISKDAKGNFFFNYKVAGKINIGSVQTYVTKSGDTLNVMYDISKLVTLLQKVSTYTQNSTISAVTSLLSSYDGITAGFKLKKK